MKWLLASLLCLLILTCLPPDLQLNKSSFGLNEAKGVEFSGGVIDLYTQLEPNSGKGSNRASDPFTLGDEVILYAYVTYNDDPIPGKLVAFEVQGPINRVHNISFIRTAFTEANGVANVSFAIQSSDNAKEATFGFWNIFATAEMGGVIIKDTLFFRVGWIVEILGVEILDAQNVSKDSFTHGEQMRFRVRVKNIAMTAKVATLTVDVFDESNTFLGNAVLKDKSIPPLSTISIYIEDLLIPNWARVGIGAVYVNAYTALPSAGGVCWCPEVSTTFEITSLVAQDVAVVSVEPSPKKVYQGGIVQITVVVKNKGTASESFNVSVFYDSFKFGTSLVENLAAGVNRTLTFNWNTSSVVAGRYNISAIASPLSAETNLADNTYLDGGVDVLPPPPPVVELSWLLLLILLIALVAAGLSGFVMGRKTRKKEGSSSERHKYPTKATKTSLGFYICPHCGMYHLSRRGPTLE